MGQHGAAVRVQALDPEGPVRWQVAMVDIQLRGQRAVGREERIFAVAVPQGGHVAVQDEAHAALGDGRGRPGQQRLQPLADRGRLRRKDGKGMMRGRNRHAATFWCNI